MTENNLPIEGIEVEKAEVQTISASQMKGNVLVIGNSGVGKSTLINAVLDKDAAKTGWGIEGTTRQLEIYESDKIPFRIIDTLGFEPSLVKKFKAINAVKAWSKASAKNGNGQINVIWFCVDGTSSKLFAETIKNLSSATAMWENVPVMVAITKSYSVPERERNIEMVHNAFARQKRFSKNLRGVYPVVAATYALNDTAYAPPEGITELIMATNELMPEGIKAAAVDIHNFNLARRRAFAHSIVGAATTAGAVVGAVPIPFADALILSPIELAEINTLARIYGIENNEETKRFLNSIVEVGTVSVAARTLISALKAIPGINLGASVLNAVIAGTIIASIGEACIYSFEQIYLGKKTTKDINWVKKIAESSMSNELVGKVKELSGRITDTTDVKAIGKMIMDIFKKK